MAGRHVTRLIADIADIADKDNGEGSQGQFDRAVPVPVPVVSVS
jgi:hypothetical protein